MPSNLKFLHIAHRKEFIHSLIHCRHLYSTSSSGGYSEALPTPARPNNVVLSRWRNFWENTLGSDRRQTVEDQDRVAVIESGEDESLNKNTKACFVKTTSHLSNSSKVEKACSGRGGDMFSLQSRRTPRSRTTLDGEILHIGSRLRFFVVLSSTLLRWSNQISSVFVAFSFRRMDAYQDWMWWMHPAIFTLVFSRCLQQSFM